MSSKMENPSSAEKISSKERELNQAKENSAVIEKGKKEINKLGNDIVERTNNQIDSAFTVFKRDLEENGKKSDKVRSERNLSIERLKDWKLRLKSYGKDLELDLKTWEISCMKWWKSIVLWTGKKLLDISNERSYLGYSDLYHVFGQMNVINRAVSVADKVEVPEKRFYFERDGGLFLHHLTNDYLKVGSKDKKNNSQVVISFLWIKKWFGDKVKKEEILGILNNAIL